MKYRVLLLITGFFLLDILIFPPDLLSPHQGLRGQTEAPDEATQDGENDSADQIINLQDDVDIIDLVNAVSELKEEIYVIDESVKPREISIITPKGGMKKEDMLMFFETVLRLNGLAVVKSDGVNKIVNSEDIESQNTPVVTDEKD
jgi:type II secretory pathway component GspD/PulD (secretin)